MFARDVKAIEAVEIDELVVRCHEDAVPFPMVELRRTGNGCLDDNNPGSKGLAIPAFQHAFLKPLHINLQPVGLPAGVVAKHLCKREHRHHHSNRFNAMLLPVATCVGVDKSAQARARQHVDFQGAFHVGERHLQHRFVRPVLAQQLGKFWHRFNMHPAPAVLVESLADRVDDRMLGANIDIKPALHVL